MSYYSLVMALNGKWSYNPLKRKMLEMQKQRLISVPGVNKQKERYLFRKQICNHKQSNVGLVAWRFCQLFN